MSTRIRLRFDHEVAVVPASAVAVLARASATDLRVLLALCADAAAREDMTAHAARLCERVGCTAAELDRAVAFWRGSGVLDTAEDDTLPAPAEAAAEPTLQEEVSADGRVRVVRARHATTLPQYTTEELTAILEKRSEMASVIHECQAIMGSFREHDTKILAVLMDYLSLDGAYIILLCSHCVKLGKNSMKYVESVALDMVENGVTDIASLQETLRREDEARDAEHRIRTLYGAGGRKLTPTEKKYIKRWTEEWQFDFALIERAYETAVDTKGEASMRYADGILKRWHEQGLTTLGQIEEADERWRAAQEHERAARGSRRGDKGKSERTDVHTSGSFDTDDFFEAALKRSFDDL